MLDPRIEKYLSFSKVFIDLGCGSGETLDALVGRYETLIGIDAFETRHKMRKAAPIGWEFSRADLNQPFPLPADYADTVFANQVIEHIADPRFFASEIYRVLRKDGVSIITTPNVRYIKQIWRIVVRGLGPCTANGEQLDGPWDDGHVHYFTHKDLRNVFKAAGFSSLMSQALIDLSQDNWIRRILDHYASTAPVREFLSGNILLVAKK
ncbi:MAG TPA: class I SAM-dependent methyltransferase [Candidatus Moranbacteria bacterium]|nr:class I SAM-dependent methyltransferase [Candidatus Moranbacteria bacterium]